MNHNERNALIRNREQAERLAQGHRPSGPDYSSAAFERLAERQVAEAAQRSGNLSALDNHYQRNSPLLTGFEPAHAKAERKLQADAAAFVEDPAMERFLEWEAKGDPRIDKIDPTTRMSMGFYRRQKDAAKEVKRGR